MPEPVELGSEDAKLVALARSARARNGAAEGAAVRDDTGRTYVATPVDLPSLSVSALQAAVVMAVASGSTALEAAALVGDTAEPSVADLAAVADLSSGTPIVIANPDGTARAVVFAR